MTAVETWTVDQLGPLTWPKITTPDFFKDMPVRVTKIPAVCWEAEDELTQAQREEIDKWKQDFAETTMLWLPTRRDAEGQADAIEAWRRDFGAWRDAWLKAHPEVP
jgi:hypothetical protein